VDPFTVRRVVTEVDAKGRAMWAADGPPPVMAGSPDGRVGVADVWALTGPPASPAGGSDSLGPGFPLEPPVGGLSWRIIRLPAPDPHLPREKQFVVAPGHEAARPRGMHATDTLDLVTVLDGRIELEVEEGCVQLSPGDCVVQRGTSHRWRVLDGRSCTYSVVMLRPDPSVAWPVADLAPRPAPSPVGIGPRRVVTGMSPEGRSVLVCDGEAPGTFAFAGGAIGYAALWETGGPVGSPLQGGDPVRPWIQLDPIGGGVSFKHIVLPPASASARLALTGGLGPQMQVKVPGMRTTGHHDPDDPARHRTDTVDLDVVVEGEIELCLPDGGPTRLSAGDCIVQRGTWHTWRNVGDTPARLTAVMVAAPPLA
jgi:quercetin dioxygenase-like cupin family protein